MNQRNQLLRYSSDKLSMNIWELEMAKSAAYITNKRNYYLRELINQTQKFYADIFQTRSLINFNYLLGGVVSDNMNFTPDFFTQKYAQSRQKDQKFGSTSFGPHRDDLLILIDKVDARFFASEGQQRALTTALHIAAKEILTTESQEIPIFLFDDITMGLDDARSQKIIDIVSQQGQIFVTTTNKNILKENHQTNIIKLNDTI